MIILKKELTIEDFFRYDLNLVLGREEFGKILKVFREHLYGEIPMVLDISFNDLDNKDYKYDNYVVEYKEVAWGEERLNVEMFKYKISGAIYRFNGNTLRYDIFKEMVLNKNPFDLYLYIKTIDEYKKEELIKYCEERGATPIFIKEDFKKKEVK